jgi:DNA-binding LacI/PurR family transcriptional regulator
MSFPSRPSIVDIARAAGVSPLMVTSVVSGDHERAAPVSPDVARRVHSAMQSLGYRERQRPEQPRERSLNVLMLVCRMGSYYSRALVAHTQAGLAQRGVSVTVQEGEGAGPIAAAARLLAEGMMDGLIVETDDETAAAVHQVATSGYPIVAIGPKSAGSNHDVVTVDDSNAIRDAMLHVVDRGYEQFVLISPRSDSNRDYRTTVARDQLRALGVQPDRIATLYSDHDPVAAFEMISPRLEALRTPVAIVTGSDSCAIGVLWACMRAGLTVPRDIAILGHGNSPEAAITSPSISTIGPDAPDLGTAAELIAARIDDPTLPGRHVVEPWRFIPRDST